MNPSKIFGRLRLLVARAPSYVKRRELIFTLLIFGAAARSNESGNSEAQGPADVSLQEIVVTAQKREQSVYDVPMSIQAATGDTLLARGIDTTADLVKLVPGFTATTTAYGTPVYTLRGMGLFDMGFASSPTVSVYVDQIPLPYTVMTIGSTLDLERVEVLKGPQGILFGENSTAGAINYIAAKPTDTFAAGTDLTYERFGQIDADGFISGPISDTLKARAAVKAIEGGAWQISATRPGDQLGDQRQLMGRVLLDWEPNDRLTAEFNINGNQNNSDAVAEQLVKVTPTAGGTAEPALYQQPIVAGFGNAREADWTPTYPNRFDDNFYQAAAHVNYAISDSLNLTSLTSYEDQRIDHWVDLDATALPLTQAEIWGYIKSVNQELRIAGDKNGLHWVTGANYAYDKIDDNILFYYNGVSVVQPFPDIPPFPFDLAVTDQKVETSAAFANVEYALSNNLSGHAGIRYTDSYRKGLGCTSSNGGTSLPEVFTRLQQVFLAGGQKNTPVVPLGPSDCVSLTPAPDLSPLVNGVEERLSESNVSWRVGFDYKSDAGNLFYANASRGYKAGVISNISSSTTSTYAPAKQEKVDAFEVGLKASMLDQRVHLDAAAFDYEYTDKQVRTRELDPIFGLLELIENVPRSRISGVEGDMEVRPLRGLALTAAATYLHSEVTSSFNTVNQEGIAGDFRGSRLPYTPTISMTGDAQYQWAAFDTMSAFVGSSLTYRSSDNTSFQVSDAEAPDYRLPSRALLDLRAGLVANDDSWRVMVFGRNVTNRYYWDFVFAQNDTIGRQAGLPAIYGISMSRKFR
jgi:iron complex outermembrane recepter protein